MRPFVFVVAPNPFEDAETPPYETAFWLRTRSGHLASFSNLLRLFNPVGAARTPILNPVKAARPLAGFYLESFLKTRGYDARAVFTLDDAGTWATGSPSPPVAVALSTTFITSPVDLARTLRRVRAGVGPDVPVVVGGALVWKHHHWGPERFAGRPEFEGRPELAPLFSPEGDPSLRDAFYVASEFGEHTLLRVLEALRAGARTASDLSDLENLVLWTDEGWRFTHERPEPIDLDRDFTRWDIVDEIPQTLVPLRTSVGCPFECEFCDFVAIHPRLQLRSVGSIVEELRLIAARGATSISIADDNALASRGRAKVLANAFFESGVGMRWAGHLRADRVSEDEAELLAQSGLMYAWCGVESGDREQLRRMGKRSDPGAARVGIDSLVGAGVHVLATFILGFPGETKDSVDNTMAFLNSLRTDARGRVEYLVLPFQLAPGSPIDAPERRREFGLTGLVAHWRHATMNAEQVRAFWAPYFFRGVDVSYGYYGGDNSALWSTSRRNDAIAFRKALTVSFLDDAPDDVVQARFADLHRTLRLTPGGTPSWKEHLAPRDQQPAASRLH